MDLLQEYFKGDKLAETLGMKIESGGRHAVVTMPVAEMHMNGMGAVHGAPFSWPISALPWRHSHGRAASAINCSISFLRGEIRGADRHGAGAISRQPDRGLSDGSHGRKHGALVASMQAQVFRTQENIESFVAARAGETPRS